MRDYTRFKGVDSYGQDLLSDQIEFGCYSFVAWSLLGIGAFSSVGLATPGSYGGLQSRLRPVFDPNYNDGQVWEGFRKDWVWETGLALSYQPVRVSGVYVNGTFQPVTASGVQYSHHVDYPLGRVVFDSPVDQSTNVSCEYSYRHVQLYTADVPWWQEVQALSFRVDDPLFLTGSGAWSELSQNRIQLPAVIVEAEMKTERYGFELGSDNQIVRQDVLLHVLAEVRPDMKRLHDIFTAQKDKRIQLYDKNAMLADDSFPLDDNGTPAGDGRMYPDLVERYAWRQARFVNTRSSPQPRLGGVHYALVRMTVESDVP